MTLLEGWLLFLALAVVTVLAVASFSNAAGASKVGPR